MARHKLSPLGSVILNSMFLVHSGKICRVGAAGPSLRETHLSDAAGVCALHGLNLKHPETSDSSVNQDVRITAWPRIGWSMRKIASLLPIGVNERILGENEFKRFMS